jgi:membrane-bound inhibitor of C-type lysozyme
VLAAGCAARSAGGGASYDATFFRCGDQNVSIVLSRTSARLSVAGETFEMRPVESASGARYEAVADATTTFWDKSDRALLVLRGKAFPECARAGGAGTPRQ